MKEIISFLRDTESDSMEWSQDYYQESFIEIDSDEEEYDYEDEESETFEIILTAEKNDSDEPYDIDAAQDWDEDLSTDTIELNIEINPELFTKSLINKFQAELKDTIRHEMEHLYQNNNPNKNIELTDYDNFVDEVLLARDARELRAYILSVSPDINMKFTYEGNGFTEEGVSIPLGISFFWPDAST
jgi:hypothetical protein